MNLRNSHTLISAYVALATITIGLLAYDALRSKPTGQMVSELTLESVKAELSNRIASRNPGSDQHVQ